MGFIVRVHCGLPSRGTPAHKLLAPLQPFLQPSSTPPARAEPAFSGSDRDRVFIAVKTCFPCIQRELPAKRGAGDAGRGGDGRPREEAGKK